MIRPGRRQALTGLLAGAVTLIGGSAMPVAAKKKPKSKGKSCPTCPAPVVCPPQLDTCPMRTCCACTGASPTPGCHYGPYSNVAPQVCDQVCGAGLYSAAISNFPAGRAPICTDGEQCVQVICPLG